MAKKKTLSLYANHVTYLLFVYVVTTIIMFALFLLFGENSVDLIGKYILSFIASLFSFFPPLFAISLLVASYFQLISKNRTSIYTLPLIFVALQIYLIYIVKPHCGEALSLCISESKMGPYMLFHSFFHALIFVSTAQYVFLKILKK